MGVKMTLDPAVSAQGGPTHYRFCLLPKSTWAISGCAETATAMVAEDEHVRRGAYWQHYKTHFRVYAQWAVKHHFVDSTLRSPEEWEQAESLVDKAFKGFFNVVMERRYDPRRGPPCRYIKRAIKNQFQNLLRRGIRLTQQECLTCWESNNGSCPHFDSPHPWDDAYTRCYHPPQVTDFDEFEQEESSFAIAGLQEQWPPIWDKAYAPPSLSRPVEEIALSYVMIDLIERLSLEVLTHTQRIVLVETAINHKTSREIALIIGTTPGNVDQLRRRALRQLYNALTQ